MSPPTHPRETAVPPNPRPRRATLLAGAAVLLTALALFAPTLAHEFVWDDRSILLPRLALSEGSGLGELLTSEFFREIQEEGPFDYWRPLVVLSHRIEWSLFGDRPAGYHAVNVVLHALAALAVFGLGLQTLGRLGPALAAGLLFAVHPVHVEVVAWISGRSDLLAGLLLALALLADWRGGTSGRRVWLLAALLCFAAALGSKESAAVFPALVAGRVWLVGPAPREARSRAAAALRASLPALAVLVIFLWVRHGLLEVAPPEAADSTHRLGLFWTWWSAFWLYTRLLVWPAGLSIAHGLPLASGPFSWSVAAGLLVAAAALWGAWRLRRAAPGVSFALLLFPLAMAPLSNFLVPISSHSGAAFPLAERFLYAPSIGFCLALGWLLTRAGGPLGARGLRSAAAVALLGLALGAGAWRSTLRARDWQSDATLFAATVRAAPGRAMARLNYGAALLEQAHAAPSAQTRRALLLQAREHLEQAVTLAPGNYRSHYDLGNLYDSLGSPQAAERAYREALRLRPDLFGAMINLGVLLARNGRPAEALEWLDAAGRRQPGSLAVMVNRAHLLQELGRPEEAILLYRQALAVEPGLAAASAGLERALATLADSEREGS